MFFRLSSVELGLVLVAVVFGTTALGLVLGHYLRHRSEHLREPFGVLQAALLGLVGLVLAFGLALAVGRYESRRAAVVEDANAIGTTYLRAQTLAEPIRTQSLRRLVRYTDTSIRLSEAVPTTAASRRAVADGEAAARALGTRRTGARRRTRSERAATVRRDSQRDDRHADGQGRRPEQSRSRRGAGPGSDLRGRRARALAFYLAILGRGVLPVLLAAGLICCLLLVTFDLDRPTRGLIGSPRPRSPAFATRWSCPGRRCPGQASRRRREGRRYCS